MSDQHHYPPQPAFSTGLAGRCPRCGEGKMFSGFLSVAPTCENCGLDFKFADAGDGPAVFVMLIMGFVVVGLALWFDAKFEPPMWVHLVVTLPIGAIACLALLRPLKGILIAQQYAKKAEPGRLS